MFYQFFSFYFVELFSVSLSAKTKLKGLIEIISSAYEYENLPIRQHEDSILKQVCKHWNFPKSFTGIQWNLFKVDAFSPCYRDSFIKV